MLKNIYKKIKQYNEIVIARHIGPDPDAIAAQICLRDAIKLTFPQKKVYAVGAGVSKFKYYGTLDKLNEDTLNNALLIVVDVPNALRIDGADVNKYKEIIKIDHHPKEDTMGSVEWVDEKASSTCQMITELILNTRLKLNRKIAENLFLGIVSDSDRFLLSYTTVRTFEIIAQLLRVSKINFPPLYSHLYTRPLAEIRFFGYLSTNLIVTENGFGYINISDEIIKEYGVDTATASNMVNDFNYIKEVIAWMFITYDEKNDIYKINIRSRGPVINEIAGKFNGGGHKYASGIRTTDARELDNIIKDLDNICKEYKNK